MNKLLTRVFILNILVSRIIKFRLNHDKKPTEKGLVNITNRCELVGFYKLKYQMLL